MGKNLYRSQIIRKRCGMALRRMELKSLYVSGKLKSPAEMVSTPG
jgi:hypothetical protein